MVISLFNLLDLFLYGAATLLSFIIASKYFILYQNKTDPVEARIVKGYTVLFLCLAVEIGSLGISFIFLEGDLIGFNYYGTFSNPGLLHQFFIRLSFVSFFFAIGFYLFYYAKAFKATWSYLVSIYCIIWIILTLILSYEIAVVQLFIYNWLIISMLFMHSLYNILRHSKRELRASTSFIIIGTIFIGQFMGWMTPYVMISGVTPTTFMIFLWILGCAFILVPTIVDPTFFARGVRYWYGFCIVVISIGIITTVTITLFVSKLENIMIGLMFAIYWSIESIFILKYIKSEETKIDKDLIQIGGVFTKPKSMTEKEVTMYRDQAVCLVCKGKIANFSFICGNCKALYCEKCVRFLMNKENICWACESILDPNNPIRKEEMEEEELKIREQKHKAKKN